MRELNGADFSGQTGLRKTILACPLVSLSVCLSSCSLFACEFVCFSVSFHHFVCHFVSLSISACWPLSLFTSILPICLLFLVSALFSCFSSYLSLFLFSSCNTGGSSWGKNKKVRIIWTRQIPPSYSCSTMKTKPFCVSLSSCLYTCCLPKGRGQSATPDP